jgi:TPR repeat protein
MYSKGAGMEDSDRLRCAYRLGDMHYKGKNYSGIPDYKKAFEWYSLAVSIGDTFKEWQRLMVVEYAAAQFRLAKMYKDGRGVAQDYAEAVRLYTEAVRFYTLAAAKGNAEAAYNLAKMYEDGQGVAQDDVEAVRLYTLAAAKGNADAQVNLAKMYKDGRGG